MKQGQRIVYVTATGKQKPATVVEITGAGASLYKIMTISVGTGVDQEVLTGVVHGKDREKGKGYWLLDGEVDEVPDRRTPEEKQVAVMSETESMGRLPSTDRRQESGSTVAAEGVTVDKGKGVDIVK